VVFRGSANRRGSVREIGQIEEKFAQLALNTMELGLEPLRRITDPRDPPQPRLRPLRRLPDPRDLGQQRRGVFSLTLCDADLLGQRIASSLELLRAHLDVLALALERLEALGIESYTALGQARGDKRKIVAQEIDVEHRAILSNG